MQASEKPRAATREIRGILSLKGIREIDPALGIKFAVARDCRIIHSQVFRVEPGQAELEFAVAFPAAETKDAGVRLVVGPADASDEQLRSLDTHEQWVPAAAFKDRVARVDIRIPPRLYQRWRIVCRTYTIRGRVVCRRIVWDRREGRFVICDAPVRGARVQAYDVDRLWWWCRRDEVGSDFTDLNGNFEISFRWCCWRWRPWLFRDWMLDPALVRPIRDLLQKAAIPEPIPHPAPEPDFSLFGRLLQGAMLARGGGSQAIAADSIANDASFTQLGERLAGILPDAPELKALHIWPWWPFFDCRPDIVFSATQDCGHGERVIYSESCAQTRWDIDPVLNGVTLVANSDACCAPSCCDDPPDDDCLVFHGVGCGGYPLSVIEQNPAQPLLGFAHPGTQDRPFGGSIRILGVLGDASDVDYYKLQYQRVSPAPTAWADLPDSQVSAFSRGHWLGVFPWTQWESVDLQTVDGQRVLKSKKRYREEHPEVSTTVDPTNDEILTIWKTASFSTLPTGATAESPNLNDGVYQLRVVGYHFNAATNSLENERVMPLCPGPGGVVDPAAHATMYLRLDNRASMAVPGTVHLDTTEPDCDFPTICAVVKNEGMPDAQCVGACGIVRLRKDDTLTIHFRASDSDGHLEAYAMSAHWADSDVFNVLSAGTLAGDPDALFGPDYARTHQGAQELHRDALPPVAAEHARPVWLGGHFKVTVTVDQLVPGNPHRAFETCCAYLLRLEVWKRTTNGCTGGYYFHRNQCEFSFTVIREDLIGSPAHPSCVG